MSLFPAYSAVDVESETDQEKNYDDQVNCPLGDNVADFNRETQQHPSIEFSQYPATQKYAKSFTSYPSAVLEQHNNNKEKTEDVPVICLESDSDIKSWQGSENETIKSKIGKKRKLKHDKSRKRRHEKKKKMERKEKRHDKKSQSSESSLITGQNKWTFLDSNQFKMNSCLPGYDPFILDRRVDLENFQYENIYKRHVANYCLLRKECLGGNRQMDLLFFGNEAASNDKLKSLNRYFDRKVVRRFNHYLEMPTPSYSAAKSCLHQSTSKELIVPDFIPISKKNVEKINGESVIWDQSIQMYVPVDEQLDQEVKQNDQNQQIECDVRELALNSTIEPQSKGQTINKYLQTHPDDIESWLLFLKVQDEIFLAEKKGGKDSGDKVKMKMSYMQQIERKMSIIDRALQKNSQSIELKLARIDIGKDIWDSARLTNEWRQVEFRHVNSPRMWDSYLSFMQKSFATFHVERQMALYDRCISKLETVLNGKMKTHQPLEGTERFIVLVLLKRSRLLFDSGYSEKAVATLQALIEFNFFAPKNLDNVSVDEAKAFFEPFWDSAAPRIGDYGAIGWAETVAKMRQNNEQSSECSAGKNNESDAVEMYEKLESCLCKDAIKKDLSVGELWAQLEALRWQHFWKPVRFDTEELEDPDRTVLYDDIKSSLIKLNKTENKWQLIFGALNLFGAQLPGDFCPDDLYSMEKLAGRAEFDLTLIPLEPPTCALIDVDRLVDRLFECAQKLCCCSNEDPNQQTRLNLLLTTRIRYLAGNLKRRQNMSVKEKQKRLKSAVRGFLVEKLQANENNNNNRGDNLKVYASFARSLLQLGDGDTARTVIERLFTQLARVNIWTAADLGGERCSALGLCKIYLDQIADSTLRTDLLANLALNGSLFSEMPRDSCRSTYLIKAKNCWLEKLNRLLTDNCPSPDFLVLSCSLGALFLHELAVGRDKLKVSLQIMDRVRNALTETAFGDWSVEEKMLAIEKLTENRIALVEKYSSSVVMASPKILKSELKSALESFPENVHFLKSFVDLNLKGHSIVELRRWFDRLSSENKESGPISLASVYMEFRRYISMVERADNTISLPEIQRIRAVLHRCAVRHPETSCFWRLEMHLEWLRGDTRSVLEVFYRAVRECPWDKRLYLDCAKYCPDRAQMLADLIAEKGLRLLCPIEEIDVLKEAASNLVADT